MSKYSFLFKPLFFMFSLLFATWLVLTIEKIRPSDFGQHKSIFESGPKPRKVTLSDKPHLQQLFRKYHRGEIDSITVEREIEAFLAPVR